MDYETLKVEAEKYKDTMDNGERMKAYAEGKEVDRIPFSLSLGEPQAPLFGYTMGEYRRSAEAQINMTKQAMEEFGVGAVIANLNLGLRGVGEALGSEYVAPEDNFDHITEYVLDDYSKLDQLVFEPETNVFLQKHVRLAKDICERMEGKCMVMTSIAGPVSTAMAIRKPELFLRDIVKDKENVHRLLAFCVECNLKWIEYVKKEFGSVVVGLSDPCTAANLISVKMFREYTKPHMKTMLDGIKKLTGRVPGIHICGKTKPFWEDLTELGFPSFSVDNCEDLAELKETVGDKMAISGNVPPVEVLRNGTIDDVIHSVQECLIKGSDSPCGYTLGIGCQIPVGTPKENLEAYLYAARRYGRKACKGKLCGGLYEEGLVG